MDFNATLMIKLLLITRYKFGYTVPSTSSAGISENLKLVSLSNSTLSENTMTRKLMDINFV